MNSEVNFLVELFIKRYNPSFLLELDVIEHLEKKGDFIFDFIDKKFNTEYVLKIPSNYTLEGLEKIKNFRFFFEVFEKNNSYGQINVKFFGVFKKGNLIYNFSITKANITKHFEKRYQLLFSYYESDKFDDVKSSINTLKKRNFRDREFLNLFLRYVMDKTNNKIRFLLNR